MASDTPPGGSLKPGSPFSVSIDCDSTQEIERLFAALGHNGQEKCHLPTFFGVRGLACSQTSSVLNGCSITNRFGAVEAGDDQQ